MLSGFGGWGKDASSRLLACFGQWVGVVMRYNNDRMCWLVVNMSVDEWQDVASQEGIMSF